MLNAQALLLLTGLLGQEDLPKPRLEIAVRESRELYTDFDDLEVDVFLVADEEIVTFITFCINADSYAFVGDFLPSPDLPWLTNDVCLFQLRRGSQSEIAVDFPFSAPSCERALSLQDGRAHLGSSRLYINPPEEPSLLQVRCGECITPGRGKAAVDFDYSGSVPLHDAQPLTLRVQRHPFVRGDANVDGAVDISDAIHVVHTMFLGGGNFRCPNAADANDDNRVDISDAVYIAGYLFLGSEPMPHPFPGPGYDRNATSPWKTGCQGL